MTMSAVIRVLHETLKPYSGRSALLAVNNTYRIPTIDSGICKGAMEIFDMTWNDRRYIAKTFPGNACFYFVKQHLDMDVFDHFTFVSIDGDVEGSSLDKIQDFFKINLRGLDCPYKEFRYYGGRVLLCRRMKAGN